MYISPVANRASEKCINSNVNRKAAKKPAKALLNMRFVSRNIMGIMEAAAKTPKIRQPNGFMPNVRMPEAIMSFPSGGCVHS